MFFALNRPLIQFFKFFMSKVPQIPFISGGGGGDCLLLRLFTMSPTSLHLIDLDVKVKSLG